MFSEIQELIDLGFNFECGAHRDAEGYYAVFDRRFPPEPDAYCRETELSSAIRAAYDQAKGWLNL